MKIRPVTEADRTWIAETVAADFGSSRVASRGVLHDVLSLPGLIAVDGTTRTGLLLYRCVADACEVVVLISLRRRKGIGRGLMQAVEEIARHKGCARIWLVTTNNNDSAMAFYRSIGWRQAAVHAGAVDEARKLKPEIPAFDTVGRPIRDEIEFERRLLPGATS